MVGEMSYLLDMSFLDKSNCIRLDERDRSKNIIYKTNYNWLAEWEGCKDIKQS